MTLRLIAAIFPCLMQPRNAVVWDFRTDTVGGADSNLRYARIANVLGRLRAIFASTALGIASPKSKANTRSIFRHQTLSPQTLTQAGCSVTLILVCTRMVDKELWYPDNVIKCLKRLVRASCPVDTTLARKISSDKSAVIKLLVYSRSEAF